MATPPEQPWSNFEKNYLLAEIIKAANAPPEMMFSVIRNLNVQPRWEDIPLPPGRSLNSCRLAFDDLRRSLSTQPYPQPAAPTTPTPLSAPINLKRTFQYDAPYAASGSGREIRPKPSVAGAIYNQPSSAEPPPKRKRGRPTKAEAQAKAEAAAATGSGGGSGETVGAAAATQQRSTSASLPPQPQPLAASSSAKDTKPVVPPSTRMPIAAMLTPTAREAPTASQSSSSSGKRRRARSSRSEFQDLGDETRMPAGTEDSPARTAVLRHRDDPRPVPPPPPPPPAPAEATKEAESQKDTR